MPNSGTISPKPGLGKSDLVNPGGTPSTRVGLPWSEIRGGGLELGAGHSPGWRLHTMPISEGYFQYNNFFGDGLE